MSTWGAQNKRCGVTDDEEWWSHAIPSMTNFVGSVLLFFINILKNNKWECVLDGVIWEKWRSTTKIYGQNGVGVQVYFFPRSYSKWRLRCREQMGRAMNDPLQLLLWAGARRKQFAARKLKIIPKREGDRNERGWKRCSSTKTRFVSELEARREMMKIWLVSLATPNRISVIPPTPSRAEMMKYKFLDICILFSVWCVRFLAKLVQRAAYTPTDLKLTRHTTNTNISNYISTIP